MRKVLDIIARMADRAHLHGPGFAWRAALWKAATALGKTRIMLEDRLGWYTYARWMRDFEPPAESLANRTRRATFSLLVVYDGPPNADHTVQVALTTRSIEAQVYPHWDARLVCATPTPLPPPAWPAADERFFPLPAAGNEDWPALIAAARGNFILAIPSGATLAPHALSEYALRLEAVPDLDILYSDLDYLKADGLSRHSPLFLPDWSPELLLSFDFLEHAAVRGALLQQAASGLNPGENSSYSELIHRTLDQDRRVAHISKVLLHLPGGAAPAVPGGQHIHLLRRIDLLHRFLSRKGLQDVQVNPDPAAGVRVSWRFTPHRVSIIIPTCDQVDFVKSCIESIYAFDPGVPFEIILVDSGSRQPATLAYYETLRSHPEIHFVDYFPTPNAPFNFSAALNLGASHAGGDFLLFLNNDAQALHPGWLEELARWASLPEVGVVGAELLYPDGSIQHAGIVMGMEGHASHVFGGSRPGTAGAPAACGPYGSPGWYRNYSAVTGACMMIRQEVFAALGGFDEAYELVFSDIEICLRARARGLRVVYTPHARLIHHEGRTRYRYMPPGDLRRGYEHFKEIVQHGDPFYNPNLSTSVRIPTLRRPGEQPAIRRLEHILHYLQVKKA